EHCILYLQGEGIRSIKLDATPDGQKVYEGLGFQVDWPLTRWERDKQRELPSVAEQIREFRHSNLEAVLQADSTEFGVNRTALIKALIAQSQFKLVAVKKISERLDGFGLMRNGSRAWYLGPVVADDPDCGIALIMALLQKAGTQKVFWDIPDHNVRAVIWAKEHGFTLQRKLTRMYLGENISGKSQ